MKADSKIFVAGHKGMVGSAIYRTLLTEGFTQIHTQERKELDLTNQVRVDEFFKKEQFEYVFLAAAKVGGISANNRLRAEFIFENLQIQNNIIHAAYRYGVKKLLFLGSSCIYPRDAEQPLKEKYLLNGELEYTNEPYAIAKIAGIKMCESYNIQYGTNFISAMPTNLFGINDNYDLENSHVLPALMRKIILGKLLHEGQYALIEKDFSRHSKERLPGNLSKTDLIHLLVKQGIKKKDEQVHITLWGTGTPMREFLFADDLADACLFLMKHIDFVHLVNLSKQETRTGKNEIRNTHINIGTGQDISIMELAGIIKKTVGFKGHFNWDSSKPDGTPRKYLDVSRLSTFGWKAQTSLKEGIEKVYNNYMKELMNHR